MSAGAVKVLGHLQAVHQTVERMRHRIPYLLGLKTEALEDLLRELSRIDASLRRAGRELRKMDVPGSEDVSQSDDVGRRMARWGDQLDLGDHR